MHESISIQEKMDEVVGGVHAVCVTVEEAVVLSTGVVCTAPSSRANKNQQCYKL